MTSEPGFTVSQCSSDDISELVNLNAEYQRRYPKADLINEEMLTSQQGMEPACVGVGISEVRIKGQTSRCPPNTGRLGRHIRLSSDPRRI